MKSVKNIMIKGMYFVGMGYLALHIGAASPALATGGHGYGHDRDECSNRTLKGTYVFTQDGIESRLPSTTQPAGDRRPFGYAGIEKYDGHGNFTGINSLATARRPDQTPGASINEFLTYSGTYTVNPDCTVVWSSIDADGFTSNYHLFLSPDGEKFTFILISAEVSIGGVLTLAQDIVGVGTAYRSER